MPTQTIPNGWKKVKLGEVCNFSQGIQIPINKQDLEQKEGYVRFIRIVDYTNNDENPRYIKNPGNKYFVEKKDVVMIRYGSQTAGLVVRGIKGYIANNMFKITPKNENLDKNYLYWFLKQKKVYNFLHGSNVSATMPAITFEQIKNLSILLPSLPVQRKVASILSAYDELIENNNKRIKILEQMGKAIFDDMMKQAEEKGELEEVKVTEVIDFLEGPGLRRWQYKNEGIPILNIRVIEDGEVNLKKIDKYLDIEEVKKKYSHFLLKEYDHIISTSGTLGKFATIRKSHLPLCLNTSIIRFRPKNDKLGVWFIKHYLKNGEFKFKLKQMATGVAQKNFGPMHLKQIYLKLPNKKLINTFENKVSSIELEILTLMDQNQNLKQTRDLLIPQLVSGRLNVEKMKVK